MYQENIVVNLVSLYYNDFTLGGELMPVISVLLDKKLLQDINENIIEAKRSKLVDRFLLEQYRLPSAKEELMKIGEYQQSEDMVIQPFSLSDEAAYKLDKLILEYKSKIIVPKEPTRSMLFRDVLQQFCTYVSLNPLNDEQELKFVHLNIAPEIKTKIEHYLPKMERSQFINDFIMEKYIPEGNINKLKEVPSKKKKMGIYFKDEALEKLDIIVDSFKGGVKRTHIIRDLLNKISHYLEENDIKGEVLEKNFRRSLEDLYSHNPEKVDRILEEYAEKYNRDKKL